MRTSLVALAGVVLLSGQDRYAGGRKHLSVPIESSAQPFVVTAKEIDRGAEYPSVIHLRGDVEIRMPVCVTTGPGAVQRCAGAVVLHADEADLHEQTGQIEARGTVGVTRR